VADQVVQIYILKRSTQKSGERICKTAGCEDERARRLEKWQRPAGRWTLEIELLSRWTIEPGESAHPQGSAGAKREASSPRLSPHYALMRPDGFEVNGKRVARIREMKGAK
jgi:hypothetical protein